MEITSRPKRAFNDATTNTLRKKKGRPAITWVGGIKEAMRDRARNAGCGTGCRTPASIYFKMTGCSLLGRFKHTALTK